MLKYHKINEIEGVTSKDYINLQGWAYNLRVQKDIAFISLRDNTGIIQAVVKNPSLIEKLSSVSRETSLVLGGTLIEDSRAPGGYEVQVASLEIIGYSNNFPIKSQDHGIDYLLNNRHLHLRSPKYRDIFKIKSDIMKYSQDWFTNNDWVQVTPPILNQSAAEGGASLFEVDYFGEKAYLSQSAQLYLEALSMSLGSVWSLTPSFRAEKSRTPRHLAEYWHLEGESSWMEFNDVLKVEEELFSYIVQKTLENRVDELKNLDRKLSVLEEIKPPFEKITYANAIDELHSKFDIEFGDDLGIREERELTKDMEKPIFITYYPTKVKSFYVKELDTNPDLCLSADMLAPEGFGELTTGGQREEGIDKLIERIKREGFNPEDYSWYLDLRRYGSVPHSGFGLGIERATRWIIGLENIRDAIPFPRTINRIRP